MSWEEGKKILRPDLDTVNMGVMEVDKDICTQCGLCMQNCPSQIWEEDEDGYPKMKESGSWSKDKLSGPCFSCFNCMVPCPVDAIKIVSTYHVSDGFWKSAEDKIPFKMPLDPKDENGNPTKWNEIERLVLTRRSVRHFKEKKIPESILERVLEAGRFAPSAGNCQPWRFIVITDRSLLKEIETVALGIFQYLWGAYSNDDAVKSMTGMLGPNFTRPGLVDPRIQYVGARSVVENKDIMGISFDAPAVILILGDYRSISSPEINVGICGQNMNLVANTLGIKALWSGMFAAGANTLSKKLGIEKPYSVVSSLILGYPEFKQEGMVPREYREVVWFREEIKEKEAQSQTQTDGSTVKA